MAAIEDLLDYVTSLQREVTPPGSSLFSTVSTVTWVGYLTDAFWEARLDGLLEGYVVDSDVDSDDATMSRIDGADVDRKDIALVVLYAGMKVLRNRILNMQSGFKAKAGSVEYEQNSAGATVLSEMLKQLRETKNRLLYELDSDASGQTYVQVLDTFSTRVLEGDWGGYYPALGMSG